TGFIIENTRNKPPDRIGEYSRCQFTSTQYVIADRNFHRDQLIPYPLIHSLVMTTQHDQIAFQGQSVDQGLLKRLTVRSQINNFIVFSLGLQRFDAFKNRFHLHDHPGSPTVRIIINLTVLPYSKFSQVMGMDLQQAFILSPFHHTVIQTGFKKFGYRCNNVNSHFPEPSFAYWTRNSAIVSIPM